MAADESVEALARRTSLAYELVALMPDAGETRLDYLGRLASLAAERPDEEIDPDDIPSVNQLIIDWNLEFVSGGESTVAKASRSVANPALLPDLSDLSRPPRRYLALKEGTLYMLARSAYLGEDLEVILSLESQVSDQKALQSIQKRSVAELPPKRRLFSNGWEQSDDRFRNQSLPPEIEALINDLNKIEQVTGLRLSPMSASVIARLARPIEVICEELNISESDFRYYIMEAVTDNRTTKEALIRRAYAGKLIDASVLPSSFEPLTDLQIATLPHLVESAHYSASVLGIKYEAMRNRIHVIRGRLNVRSGEQAYIMGLSRDLSKKPADHD